MFRRRVRSIAATLALLPGLVVATASPALAAPPTFTAIFNPDTITPGATSTLTYSITGVGNPATNVAFTNTLPAGVTLASPANANMPLECTDQRGGSTSLSATDGGTTVTLSGGQVAGDTTCEITVDVTSSTPGAHVNTTGDLTSSQGNSGTATDTLTVGDGVSFAKAFAPSTVVVGDTTRLTFTIDNTGSGSDLSNPSFSDLLPDGLVVADPANDTSDCPIGNLSYGETRTSVNYSSFFGTVAAGGSCTISVDIDTTSTGTKDNVTSDLSYGSGSAPPAKATLTVDPIPPFDKDFNTDPTAPGGTVDLAFTIQNLDRANAFVGITFDDDLDAVLTGLAPSGPLPTDPCGTGSILTFTTGVLKLTGGSLPPEGSCTFTTTLAVPGGSAPGEYPNTTTALSGTAGGSPRNLAPATDTLVVQSVPVLTFEVTDDPIGAGSTATFQYTLTNTSTTSTLADGTFTQSLAPPLGFPVSATLPVGEPCGAGSTLALIIPNTDQHALQLNGATLAAAGSPGDNCTFDVLVDVPVGFPGNTYPLPTKAPSATVDGTTVFGDPATDGLVVIGAPRLTKSFTDDPVTAGDTVTLEFTLDNPGEAAVALTDIGFTDDLDATITGLVATGTPIADVCGAGSSLAGTDTLTLSGASLDAKGSCTFQVTLQVPGAAAPGTYTNTTSDVTATGSTVTTTGSPASGDLVIAALTLAKEFTDDPVLPGGTVTLRFSLDNTTGTHDATGIGFTDDLNAMLSGTQAVAPLPDTSACGAGSSLSGTTFLTFSGGELAVGASCSFDVTVEVPVAATVDTYTNTTSNLSYTYNGSGVTAAPASDDLVVIGGLLLSKKFTDDPVVAGGQATIEYIATNQHPTDSASNVSFSDDLDAAVSGMTIDSVVDGCAGFAGGTTAFQLDFGSIPAADSCTISVVVNVPASTAVGEYPGTTSAVTGTIGGLDANGDPASDDLAVTATDFSKSFAGTLTAGSTTTLTFELENLDAATTRDRIGFTDDLDAVVPGLAATDTPLTDVCGTGSEISGTSVLTFTGGSLPASGTCTITVTVTVPSTATPGSYTNTTSDLSSNGFFAAPPATAPLTVAAPAVTGGGGVAGPAPAPSADLSASTSPASQAVEAGGTATTTVTVTNAGPSTAADTTLTMTLNGTGAFGPAPAGCAVAGGQLTCDLGAVDSGASTRVDVATTHADPGDTTLTATVAGTTADPDDTNDQATATITASAPPSGDLADDCQARPSSRPSDANDGPHSGAIDCLVALDVISGFEDGSFRGTLDVSRAQFASMLVRAIDHLGLGLATNAPDAFDDDNGSPHETAANRLAAAGILEGTSDRTFSGGLPISRSQVAAVLARTVRTLTNVTVPPREDQFDDDDGRAFEAEHDTAAQLELVSGVAPRQYRGVLSISRAQTASILARFIVLVDGPVS